MQVTILQPWDHDRMFTDKPWLVGSCGREAPHAEITIVDDDGHPLPNGEVGEVLALLRQPDRIDMRLAHAEEFLHARVEVFDLARVARAARSIARMDAFLQAQGDVLDTLHPVIEVDDALEISEQTEI